jgi:opacity protein-like surface antigen
VKRTCLVVLCAFLLAGLALAQDSTPKAEIFGGYSHVRADFSVGGVGFGTEGLNGWNASLAGNLNKYFGVVGDFGGTYGTPIKELGIGVDVKNYTFLFGPQFSYRTRRVTPYAHALFGADHISADIPAVAIFTSGFGQSDTAFAFALGGGLDVGLGRVVALRLAQLDYLRTQFFSSHQNNLRFSTGLVLRLGSH